MNPATKRLPVRWNTTSGVPSCSMRPARITATRSPIASASAWSWVTNTAGVPVSVQEPTTSAADLRPQVRVEAGERLVEQHQARLRAPAPWPARRAGARHPTARAGSGRRSPRARRCRAIGRAAAGARPATTSRSPNATLSATVRWGKRACSWNTSPTCRCSGSTRRVPSSTSVAADAHRAARRRAMSPATRRSSVDLPHPLGPTSASSSPSATVEVDVDRRRRVEPERLATRPTAAAPAWAERSWSGVRFDERRWSSWRLSIATGIERHGDDRQRRQRGLLEARLRRQVVDPDGQRVEADRAQQQAIGSSLRASTPTSTAAAIDAGARQRQVDPAEHPRGRAPRASGPTP